ncbi:hypothetical protein TNCV_3278051 [Trichonephila clavipes]|nr:hypothetical protein TNCV_3278051 [Trichonephila clavipes]
MSLIDNIRTFPPKPYRRKLRSYNQAYLPCLNHKLGHSLSGRPTHTMPQQQTRYGMEERFAFHFPVTSSIRPLKPSSGKWHVIYGVPVPIKGNEPPHQN